MKKKILLFLSTAVLLIPLYGCTSLPQASESVCESLPQASESVWESPPNDTPADLTPVIGEFYEYSPEDGMPIQDSSGEYYGFEEDLTPGCSVWCAIADYQVSVTATSELTPREGISYGAENIINSNRANAWVEGAEGNGIGESVSISKKYDNGSADTDYDCFFFPGLCIVNGMSPDADAWGQYNRVKTLKMYFNEEYLCDLCLTDTMKPQYISLSGFHLSAKNNETVTFRFEIADVYPGMGQAETAITGIEIRVFTPNH